MYISETQRIANENLGGRNAIFFSFSESSICQNFDVDTSRQFVIVFYPNSSRLNAFFFVPYIIITFRARMLASIVIIYGKINPFSPPGLRGYA